MCYDVANFLMRNRSIVNWFIYLISQIQKIWRWICRSTSHQWNIPINWSCLHTSRFVTAALVSSNDAGVIGLNWLFSPFRMRTTRLAQQQKFISRYMSAAYPCYLLLSYAYVSSYHYLNSHIFTIFLGCFIAATSLWVWWVYVWKGKGWTSWWRLHI